MRLATQAAAADASRRLRRGAAADPLNRIGGQRPDPYGAITSSIAAIAASTSASVL